MDKPCSNIIRCRSIRLLGCGVILNDESWASPKQLKTFHDRRQAAFSRQARGVVLFAVSMALFYAIVGGVSSPVTIFYRVNNFMSATLLTIWTRALVVSRSYGSNLHVRLGFDMMAIFIGFHYMSISFLTYGRTYRLLSWFYEVTQSPRLNPDLDPTQAELWAEPYGMLLGLLGVSICGYLRIVSRSITGILAMSPVFLWVIQVTALGTDLNLVGSIKLAASLFCISLMMSLGYLAAEADVRREFLHMNRQRSEIMEIMKGFSTPVFFLRREHISHNLLIELWNDTLLKICDVREGTMLDDVPCLRGAQCQALANAVHRALESKSEGTRRMLLHLHAASGNMWLQADVWPVDQLGENCVLVMGSDVTEFVERHQSLLRHIPEEAPYEENRKPQNEYDMVPVTADLDPASLTLSSCSPQFNVFFQQRMDGQTLLSHIPCTEEQHCVQEALQSVTSGLGPQDVSVTLAIQFRSSPKGSARKSTRSKRQTPAFSRRCTALLKFLSDDDATQHTVKLSIASYCSEDRSLSGAESEPAIPLGGNVDHRAVQRCQSDTPRTRYVSDQSSDQLFSVHQNCVTAHVIEVMRHLSHDYKDAFQAVERALHVIGFSRPDDWDGGCVEWQCSMCRAFNGDDDDVCFICWSDRSQPPPSATQYSFLPIAQTSVSL